VFANEWVSKNWNRRVGTGRGGRVSRQAIDVVRELSQAAFEDLHEGWL
jgi:hypothetical protein